MSISSVPALRLSHVCALLALSALPGAAATDPFSVAVPFVRSFRDVDGLPQNTVHALAIDAAGLLWAGTQDGAARYDGRRWEPVALPVADRAGFVRALLPAADGGLWFGTQDAGLLRWKDGRWLRIAESPTTFPTPRINAMAETGDPNHKLLWVALHDGGLASFDGKGWRTFGERDGLPSERIWDLHEIVEVDGARLWIATADGVATLRLPDGPIEPVAELAGKSWSSLTETRDARGAAIVWAGSYGDGLYRRGASGWQSLGTSAGLPSPFITDLEADPDDPGTVWIATDGGGIAQADESGVRPQWLGPLFDSRAAYRIFESKAAQGAAAIWVGTRNNGLLRMAEAGWRVVHPLMESPFPSISALLLAAVAPGSTELWVGLDGRGLSRWARGVWHQYTAAGGEIGNDTVQALLETTHVGAGRRIWAGTRNGGLSEWRDGRWSRHSQASGALPNDLVQALAEVPGRGGGELWVGTREGVAIYNGSRWRRLEAPEALARVSVLSFALEPPESGVGPGAVWLGTSNGLFRVAGELVERWTVADGLPNSSVLSLLLERRNSLAAKGRRLWIGTEGGGLARLDLGNKPPVLAGRNGPDMPSLPNGVVHALVEDRSGRIYVSTNRGVARFSPHDSDGDTALFTTEHGLPLNQGSRGAAAVDANGRIWIGTAGGLAVLEPGRDRPDRTPKRVRLSFAAQSNSGADLASGVRLPHDVGALRFRFVLLSFLGEPLTRYRTELVGVDRRPSEWAAHNERELSGLAPGHYRFRAWGRDFAGNVSPAAEVEFSIAPAFWQRFWFRAAVALVVIGALLGFFRLRLVRHERREHALEEQVAARTLQLERANRLLADLSYVDPVTAIANRRRFDELLEAEWKRGVRTQLPLAIVMIDVDDFKRYNDDFGHQQGDACLRTLAAVLADSLPRAGDLLARYGGEEFGAVLPATDLGGARRVAENFRHAVAQLAIEHPRAVAAPHVTVSCGVAAAVPALDIRREGLVEAADQALYAAKRAGKNRIAVAE